MNRNYTCPYCREKTPVSIRRKDRTKVVCQHCGKATVFDYDGAGMFGLWYPNCCYRCTKRRVTGFSDDGRDVEWLCLIGGCDQVVA